MEVLFQQKQAEQDKQLKQQEMELRREAEIELDIQQQKNQELQNKYQSENQQLQNKVQLANLCHTHLIYKSWSLVSDFRIVKQFSFQINVTFSCVLNIVCYIYYSVNSNIVMPISALSEWMRAVS